MPPLNAAPGERPTPDRLPRVSVIIPTYNRAHLVTHSIDSVLAQTFADYELIVVDDGSTDNTREVLEPYADRIRYVHQENGGAASARNRGIAVARGELLAFLDSDDLFEPRMLEAVIRTFDHYPEAGGVFTAERDLDTNDNPLPRVHSKRSPGRFFTTEGMLRIDTRVGAGRPAVVRRRKVEELGGFDETIGCAIDCELWIRYSFHMPLVLQPEPLVLRRFHPSNLSDNRMQDAEDWIRILQKIASDHPEFVERHGDVYRLCMARNALRYGRELLARGGSAGTLEEARQSLRTACQLRPFVPRAWIYLAWSHLAPGTYRWWRQWELRALHPAGRKRAARAAARRRLRRRKRAAGPAAWRLRDSP